MTSTKLKDIAHMVFTIEHVQLCPIESSFHAVFLNKHDFTLNFGQLYLTSLIGMIYILEDIWRPTACKQNSAKKCVMFSCVQIPSHPKEDASPWHAYHKNMIMMDQEIKNKQQYEHTLANYFAIPISQHLRKTTKIPRKGSSALSTAW